ncbi:MAG: YggT family protein [Gammaproteobacteria bacterium]|nr:YggT family protein [Gammaproteobacteria bacterium]
MYLFFLMLRFVMQASRADYYNPISQGIVKITEPAVSPFKKILAAYRGVDFATLVVALLVQLSMIMLVILVSGGPFFHPIYILWALLGLVSTLFDIYFFLLIVRVISSWVAPYGGHPVTNLVYQLTEPLCRPARRIIPPMGGLDFSVMIVMVGLILLDQYLLVRPLAMSIGVPRGLIFGLY